MRKCVAVIALMMLLTGCGSQKYTPGSNTEVEKEEDTVKLSEVRTPAFEEDFCTLSFDGSYLGVQWGAGSECVMWKESGYPGFDYPMIVTTTQAVSADAVTLTLSWGTYLYDKVCSGFAFSEGNNLFDNNSGDALVNWAHAEEILVLWDSTTGQYAKYQLRGGTKIVT